MTLHAPVKALGAVGVCVVIAICTLYVTTSTGQGTGQPPAGSEISPIYGVAIPAGYRDWQLISVGHLTGGSLDLSGGTLKQLRAQLGNDIAIKAFRDGTLP